MMALLPVVAAFMTVFGMIAFLIYCGKELDAEAARVEHYRTQKK